MRIQSFKAPMPAELPAESTAMPPGHASDAARPAIAVPAAAVPGSAAAFAAEADPDLAERQSIEIALLKARIQHLELVVETARSLMGSSQEKLLRRLHEMPREIAELSARLRRFDPQGQW